MKLIIGSVLLVISACGSKVVTESAHAPSASSAPAAVNFEKLSDTKNRITFSTAKAPENSEVVTVKEKSYRPALLGTFKNGSGKGIRFSLPSRVSGEFEVEKILRKVHDRIRFFGTQCGYDEEILVESREALGGAIFLGVINPDGKILGSELWDLGVGHDVVLDDSAELKVLIYAADEAIDFREKLKVGRGGEMINVYEYCDVQCLRPMRGYELPSSRLAFEASAVGRSIASDLSSIPHAALS